MLIFISWNCNKIDKYMGRAMRLDESMGIEFDNKVEDRC